MRDGRQGGGHLRRQFAVRMFLHVHQLCCMQTPQQVGYIRAICLSPVHAQCEMHCAQGPHYAVSAYGASCRGCSTRLLRIFPRGSLRHGVVWCTIQRAAALSDDGASPDVCIGWGLCVLLPGLQACMRCVLCWSFRHWRHVTAHACIGCLQHLPACSTTSITASADAYACMTASIQAAWGRAQCTLGFKRLWPGFNALLVVWCWRCVQGFAGFGSWLCFSGRKCSKLCLCVWQCLAGSCVGERWLLV